MNDCIVNLQHGKHYDRALDLCRSICDIISHLPLF
jgi:hypothetical protein